MSTVIVMRRFDELDVRERPRRLGVGIAAVIVGFAAHQVIPDRDFLLTLTGAVAAISGGFLVTLPRTRLAAKAAGPVHPQVGGDSDPLRVPGYSSAIPRPDGTPARRRRH